MTLEAPDQESGDSIEKMKLKEARQAYYEFSGKASDAARQLAFAGIGVVWLFTIRVDSTLALPKPLVIALFLFVLSLLFDLLHYIVGSIVWGSYARTNEKVVDDGDRSVRADEDDIPNPDSRINWPANLFFYLKLAFVISGYIALVIELWGRLST